MERLSLTSIDTDRICMPEISEKNSYSYNERLRLGLTMALLLEVPIGFGITAVFLSLYNAYQRGFSAIHSETLLDPIVLPMCGLSIFIALTTPYRWITLYRFLAGYKAAQSFFHYLVIILTAGFFITTYQIAIDCLSYAEHATFNWPGLVVMFLSLFVLAAMTLDAWKRSGREADPNTLKLESTFENKLTLASIKVFKEKELETLRKMPIAQVQNLKALGFELLGVGEEATIPFCALLLPTVTPVILLKESSTIDLSLRLITKYAILKSADGESVVSVLNNGIKFYTFFNDGWAIVSSNNTEPSGINRGAKIDLAHFNLHCSDLWIEHQKRIQQSISRGMGISRDIEARYIDHTSRSLTLGGFVGMVAASWLPIFIALYLLW